MRATAMLNRLLGFAATVVEDAIFTGTDLLVRIRYRSVVLTCPCGRRSRAGYDRSRRRWRHLDFGRYRVFVEAIIRRVDCPGCRRVRTEVVPWARPGARHTHDFEALAGWLAARMAKSAVATLLRASWEAVDGLVRRLVSGHVNRPGRWDRLRRIGVDEISYRKGRKFLTVVADHDTGRVVWIAEGRSHQILGEFFTLLGEAGRQRIEAISMDMTPIYRKAAHIHIPDAAICLDPFHVIKWASEALDLAYQATQPTLAPIRIDGHSPAQTWQKVRGTLRLPAEKHTEVHVAVLEQLRRHHPRLHRAWRYKEDLRQLYRINPDTAAAHLTRWIRRAAAGTITAFATLARRLRQHRDGILNTIRLGLSNSILEGVNAGVRLLQRRAHGYRHLDNLIEMIHYCHGGITTQPPTATR